jgi:hypothetical protein
MVAGVPVEITAPVRRREPHPPYGEELRELMIVPAVAVNVSPRVAIVPLAAARKPLDVRVELLNNVEGASSGQLTLRLPAGWTSSPSAVPFTFTRAGERGSYRFSARPVTREPRLPDRSGGDDRRARNTQGYDVIEHRSRTQYLYHPRRRQCGIDVTIAPGLRSVTSGIGDEVPAGLPSSAPRSPCSANRISHR